MKHMKKINNSIVHSIVYSGMSSAAEITDETTILSRLI